MSRSIPLALLLLASCGGDGPPPEAPEPGDEEATPDVPASPADETAPWLRGLLAYDLRTEPSDPRTTALGERLGANVICPRPGTGCYLEIELGAQTTQVHVGDDQALQVWGPTDPMLMPRWIEVVEAELDGSSLTALNEPGARPDRLFRDARHVVLLHDHSGLPCNGFCPAMVWIAPPDHPNAPGYGFEPAR